MNRRHQGGLTLIEVLAAIVIFSTGAVVLFGWIGTMANRLALITKEERLLFAELGAVEYMRTVNPMERQSGEEAIGETKVRWTAKAVGPEAAALNLTGSEGAYAVQLYKLDITVEVGRDLAPPREIYLAGWRQTKATGTQSFFGQNATGQESKLP